jgi:hypothetical protein
MSRILTRSNFCEIEVSEFFNTHRDYHHLSHFEIASDKRIQQLPGLERPARLRKRLQFTPDAQPSLASPEITPAFSTMAPIEVALRPVAKVFSAASRCPSPRWSIASPSETAKCSMTLESR